MTLDSHLGQQVRTRRRRAAREVAARLADALAEPPPTVDDRDPTSPRWRAQSLSKGAAGIAVLHGARAHAGLATWERVHAWLVHATRDDLSAGTGAGLWHGAPAVAFAISTAAPPRQYTRATQTLDAAVTRLTRARLEAANARMAAAVRPSLAEFDLVQGLTGLGAYLLRRHASGHLIRQVLTYLVRLTEPLPADDPAGVSVPGWWTSDIPSGQPTTGRYRGGHANLGMAHGIAGPLALLALAMRHGLTVDDHAATIERICACLDTWRHDGPAGPWWPQRVSLADLRTSRPDPRYSVPLRPSWCYGTPGLARAQQLAGHATGDHTRQDLAEGTLARCLSDPAQLARITDPGLCHGWAGLTATAYYAALDARCPDIAAQLPRLLDTLLDLADAEDSPAQRSGLIEGGAGIALILHTIATGTGDDWPTCLLLN